MLICLPLIRSLLADPPPELGRIRGRIFHSMETTPGHSRVWMFDLDGGDYVEAPLDVNNDAAQQGAE